MSVTFRVEHFEGPLDLLLQLVEKEKLDITTISLASVADQFVTYIHASPQIPLEEVVDFLVIAAKLLYVKSRLLVPTQIDPELEDGPDLAEQLRRYRSFVEASKKIHALWHEEALSFPREQRSLRQTEPVFAPPPTLTAHVLYENMRQVILRLTPAKALAQATILRAVTIQEKISALVTHLKMAPRTTFSVFVGRSASTSEAAVSFLALLELVKRRCIRVQQHQVFQDIHIEIHPDASLQEIDLQQEAYEYV